MQNMAMKPVLKSNLSIQMAQKTLQNMAMKDTLKSNLSIQTAKKPTKYDNENCSKEQFKHSDDQKNCKI